MEMKVQKVEIKKCSITERTKKLSDPVQLLNIKGKLNILRIYF